MYLAKEHLWSEDENGDPYQLVVPKGSEVTDEDFEILALPKNSSKVKRVADGDAESVRAAHVELGLLPKRAEG